MRASWEIISIVLAAGVACAADVRDLGVPAGLKASEYDERGFKLLNKHDYETARKYFTAALRLEPDRYSAYYNRAMTFYQQKNWAAALQDLNASIHCKPSFLEASVMRSRVNAHMHNYSASLRDYDTLAKLYFRLSDFWAYASMLNSRAWLRAVCPEASIRNGQLAVAEAKKACQLTEWKEAGYIDTLAAAYAESGDFEQATHYQEQAITVHQKEPEEIAKRMRKNAYNKVLAQKINEDVAGHHKKTAPEYAHRLELYKQHRPYREAEPEELDL